MQDLPPPDPHPASATATTTTSVIFQARFIHIGRQR
jgi:hypothetical protein